MTNKKLHYLIYKTTNLVNGKYYIGQHVTTDRDDRYLGSGTVLRDAIKKYGLSNFSREILHSFDTFEEMNEKEIELVDESFLSNPLTYNVALGGSRPTEDNYVKKNNPRFSGKSHSSESKKKMSRNHNRANRSVVMKKLWNNPEFRTRMRERKTGERQKRVECPHCNKSGGKNAMTRYHFENCKHKG